MLKSGATDITAWLIVIIVVVGACIVWTVTSTASKEVQRVHVVTDSLQHVTTALRVEQELLQRAAADAHVAREHERVVRDSLRRVAVTSDSALRVLRAQLPRADAVPDSALRRAYASALVALDSADAVIAQLVNVVLQDSVLLSASALVEDALHARVNNLLMIAATETQRANAATSAFTALQQERSPWCGRRCGVALGALGMYAVVAVARR